MAGGRVRKPWGRNDRPTERRGQRDEEEEEGNLENGRFIASIASRYGEGLSISLYWIEIIIIFNRLKDDDVDDVGTSQLTLRSPAMLLPQIFC